MRFDKEIGFWEPHRCLALNWDTNVRGAWWRASEDSRADDDIRRSGIYGFVISGCYLSLSGDGYVVGSYALAAGMWFSFPGHWRATIAGGKVLLIESFGNRCLHQVGGPIEREGRLRYIDGCTDTILIHPSRIGEPVLNHLHFPPGIRQTMHTHPSVRIGVVASGRGKCVTPDGEFPLEPGVCWYLPIDGQHCFHTLDEPMDIIAWHPDSDTGPSDHDHPMINRTYVDGVSANKLPEIQTR